MSIRYIRAVSMLLIIISLTVTWALVAIVPSSAEVSSSVTISSKNGASQVADQSEFLLKKEQLRLEMIKAWLTAGSILFPLVIAILTIYLQMRMARKQKELEAETAFKLKAAEIVLNSKSPAAARSRAKALSQLFPSYIPNDFAASFDSTILPGTRRDDKSELLKLLVAYPEQRSMIIRSWKSLFPWDEEWVNDLSKASGIEA